MLVLGIETSCDDTGVAVYDSASHQLLAHRIATQETTHAAYGGVVPELASRDHTRKIIQLIQSVMSDAGVEKSALQGIAYTAGPGLVGALMVGAAVGHSLAWSLNIPSFGVHHLEGHLLAPMLEENPPVYPFIALLVSGGHTMLIEVSRFGSYHLLGESMDDAAGEAFDKTAKMLGLPYPGGPHLAALALEGRAGEYHFTRPMINRPGLDFSFSGLKTSVFNAWNQSSKCDQTRADIAYAFQEAVVDTLSIKCLRAIEQTGISNLVVSGGVSANQSLRKTLTDRIEALSGNIYFPRHEFCTDNGAMIAYAGALHLEAGHHDGLVLQVTPRWPIDKINT